MKKTGSIFLTTVLCCLFFVSFTNPVHAQWCDGTCPAPGTNPRDGACVPGKPGFRYSELCRVDCRTIDRSEKLDSSCGSQVAQTGQCPNTGWAAIIGCVNNPNNIPGSNADEQISNFISVIIRLIFIAGAIVFVFLIVLGAFSWMTSGGEKEALAKARSRIIHAIIGLAILSLAFVIINLIAHITNIGILAPFSAPTSPQYGTQPPSFAPPGNQYGAQPPSFAPPANQYGAQPPSFAPPRVPYAIQPPR